MHLIALLMLLLIAGCSTPQKPVVSPGHDAGERPVLVHPPNSHLPPVRYQE